MRFAIAAAAVALTTGVTAQWDNPIPDFEVYMYAEEDCKFENNPVVSCPFCSLHGLGGTQWSSL